ncbi:Signal transduction histidine kinase, core [Syntrophomonas zehnderi OL-4]|uniref:histidine kinase n=1 Tax=Syntrophomonas zehnderi OL-4 TaxID=690567 RepID=A0A0E4GAP5_9FIRM|nr:ATP-binding protein [Syntrophomonas zehnderi]CFX57210.1 Signal transduction histidine kinase, core [Syntrophomonas zehnderi OL-4]
MMTQSVQDHGTIGTILSNMGEGVLVFDQDSRIILANKAAENIFWVREGIMIGQTFSSITDNEKIFHMISEVLKTGKEVFTETVIRPNTQIYRVHVTAQKDAAGDINGAVAVFQDVTDARNFDQMRSEFVGNVSHELRTPLTSIKGFVETLLDGAMENSEQCRRFLSIIDAETNRLSRLIEDLLTLSAIESKEKSMRPKPVCMLTSMRSALNILGPQISEKSLRVELIYRRDLSYILADEDLLNQVFINLLDNAIKYTPENGSIIIRCRKQDSRLITTFTDTGVGIPHESLPRVFERFYRVDKARSRDQGGTGLGLSIVKHIVELHGGEVFVESEVGKGSIFGVSFIAL